MSRDAAAGALPLRPLTAGELLDAAVSLLRTRAGVLLGLGSIAAVAEQALLYPLRRLADLDLRYLPADDRWPIWTLLVVAGFGIEATIIGMLGGPAAAGAGRALLGAAAPARPRGVGRAAATAAAVAAGALAVGLLCAAAVATMYGWPPTFFLLALLTIPLWAWLFGSLGAAAAVVVIERRGPPAALWRAVVLAQRRVLRAGRIRLLGYLGWFLIRLAWGIGALSLIGLVYTSPDTRMDNLLMAAVYLVLNALAYPMLACLDVVSYLDTRMRSEGLDIALRRALHRRVDATGALVGA